MSGVRKRCPILIILQCVDLPHIQCHEHVLLQANDREDTVKPTYNGTARDRHFSAAERFRLIQVLDVWQTSLLDMVTKTNKCT
jgi:hypothetical protein